jgi:1,4-alpha-glucan branching enzyme
VEDLNRAYRELPALHELDVDPGGFEWIDASDSQNSVITFLRRGRGPSDAVVCAFNFTPLPRRNYMIGVPFAGRWREILNSDAELYGGSGQGNMGGVESLPYPVHGRPHAINVTVPPLACLLFAPDEPH